MTQDHDEESAAILAGLAELKADKHAEGFAKLQAIQQAMTPQWKESMRSRLDNLGSMASSPRSKLPKFYLLVEEFGEIRSPHVACKAGCSACCRTIPVEISDLEAQHITKATGIASAPLPPGRHTSFDFLDTPCPFLVDNQCSIYEHRPFNCRSLAVVDRDALTCNEVNTALTVAKDPRAVPAVMSKAQQFEPLYSKIVKRPGMVWADIRQFFPASVFNRAGQAPDRKP